VPLHYIQDDKTITIEEADDAVVLSPSTYWYAHARFPTRSLARARRLADAYMDTRPSDYGAIHVEKEGDGFACYAYNADALASRLEALGAKGSPVWFLQQLASQMPLRIDEGLTADAINGVVVEFKESSRSLPALASIDLNAVARPFNRRSEGGAPARLLVALTLLLAVTVTADLAMRFQTYLATQKALDATRSTRSIYEIRALTAKYEKIAGQQQKLREQVAKALRGRLTHLRCTPGKGCERE